MAARLVGHFARFAAAIERELNVTEQEIAYLDQKSQTMVAKHELAPYVLSVYGVEPGGGGSLSCVCG